MVSVSSILQSRMGIAFNYPQDLGDVAVVSDKNTQKCLVRDEMKHIQEKWLFLQEQ